MFRSRQLTTFCLFSVVALRHGAETGRAAPAPSALPMLDDFFERGSAHGFSGAVLVPQGDTILLRKGYGFADRRNGKPATPDTIFAIASLDKQFIAAAILRLEEMGRLKASDPLSRFFDFVPADKSAIGVVDALLPQP